MLAARRRANARLRAARRRGFSRLALGRFERNMKTSEFKQHDLYTSGRGWVAGGDKARPVMLGKPASQPSLPGKASQARQATQAGGEGAFFCPWRCRQCVSCDQRRAGAKLHVRRAKRSKLHYHFVRRASSGSETMVGSARSTFGANLVFLEKRNTKQFANI